MLTKNWMIIGILIFLYLIDSACYAQSSINPLNPLGQVIQIHTDLYSYVGKPIWTLIIRDLDHNVVYPYVFDFTDTTNHWFAFTYGTHYLITASRLQIETYQPPYNTYKNCRIYNFCNLESRGRIMRNMAISIRITGNLSPNRNTYACQVTTYPVTNFYIVKPTEESVVEEFKEKI